MSSPKCHCAPDTHHRSCPILQNTDQRVGSPRRLQVERKGNSTTIPFVRSLTAISISHQCSAAYSKRHALHLMFIETYKRVGYTSCLQELDMDLGRELSRRRPLGATARVLMGLAYHRLTTRGVPFFPIPLGAEFEDSPSHDRGWDESSTPGAQCQPMTT